MSYGRSISLLFTSLAICAVFQAPAAGAAGLNPSSCAVAASDLAGAIATNSSATTYSHQPTPDGTPDVALVNGQWHALTDCSGFVSFVVDQIAPTQYDVVAALKEPGKPWPRAHIYQRFFAGLLGRPTVSPSKGWSAVPDLRKAWPGDVLAWCLNDYCTATGEVPEPGDTGHIMVIGRVMPLGADTVAVTVYDSSAVIHYGNPPYTCAPNGELCQATGRDGVGIGAIHFKINAQGAPIAFQFNAAGQWHPQPGEQIQFAIGRLIRPCN